MQNYNEPEFNTIKMTAPDVICTYAITPADPISSETDNAYIKAGKLFGSGNFFIEI
ncbi:MAG: hypothetical protein IJ731_07370 [Eubacterium sp.]|nr:hypothetical protein [Eubacterium sp.]